MAQTVSRSKHVANFARSGAGRGVARLYCLVDDVRQAEEERIKRLERSDRTRLPRAADAYARLGTTAAMDIGRAVLSRRLVQSAGHRQHEFRNARFELSAIGADAMISTAH